MLQQGNIFGESFPTEIKNQIQLREYLYGQGFESWTPQQMFQTTKRIEEIQYLNANSAWIKLVSSVNVKDSSRFKKTALSNLQMSENSLAQQYVLFGGTAAEGGGVRGGLNIAGEKTSGPDTYFRYPYNPQGDAYGVGGLETGFRPMPGIVSATVEHLNNGTLRKAVVKIKAFNRAQFEAIDALYLRLGYSMLLEWGHTIIAKGTPQDVSYQRDPGVYSLEKYFLEPTQTRVYEDYLNMVREMRLQSQGNYDGFVGRISNYSWEFDKDGSYDITLYAISQGDVIESLNINSTTTVTTSQSYDAGIYQEVLTTLAPYKQKHDLGYFLGTAAEFLQDSERHERSSYQGTVERGIASDMSYFTYFPGKAQYLNAFASKYATGEGSDTIKMFIRLGYLLEYLEKSKLLINEKGDPIVKIDYDLTKNVIPLNYYSAPMDPSICVFNLQNYSIIDTIPTYKEVEEEYIVTDREYFTPGIDFALPSILGGAEFNIDLNGLFGTKTLSEQIAAGEVFEEVIPGKDGAPSTTRYYTKTDPRKVKAKKQVKVSEQKQRSSAVFYDVLDSSGGATYGGFLDPDLAAKGIRAARIMNVHFNMEYVLSAFDSAMDGETGKVSVYKFLQKLCDGFVQSTGSYNKLTVFLDEDTNTIRIIDKVSFGKDREVISHFGGSTDYATFNIYGFNPIIRDNKVDYYQGTFIKNFNIRTELTKETATMIAISAAANNQNILGEDSTAFSKWNDGLEDRVMKYFNTAGKDPDAVQKVINEANRNFGDFILSQASAKITPDGTWDVGLKPLWNPANATIYTNAAKTLMKYDANKLALEQSTQNPGTGFLPLKVSLTMKGLSGMKILQEFKIVSDFLPSNYPEALRFLVTNIKHNIAGNEWETTIETISAPEVDITEAPIDTTRRQPDVVNTAATNSDVNVTEYKGPAPCGYIKPSTLDHRTIYLAVVKWLEGGYWNKAFGHSNVIKTKDGKKVVDTASGETMFGEDRKAGRLNPDNPLYGKQKKFWDAVDRMRNGAQWKHYYQLDDRPSDKAELLNLGFELRTASYNFDMRHYLLNFSPNSDKIKGKKQKAQKAQAQQQDRAIAEKVKALIESDGRLLFHFWYATWNGPGYFQGWARMAFRKYAAGVTTADEMLKILLADRDIGSSKYRHAFIAKTSPKIRKLLGVGCTP